jgi:hypothetical protein
MPDIGTCVLIAPNRAATRRTWSVADGSNLLLHTISRTVFEEEQINASYTDGQQSQDSFKLHRRRICGTMVKAPGSQSWQPHHSLPQCLHKQRVCSVSPLLITKTAGRAEAPWPFMSDLNALLVPSLYKFKSDTKFIGKQPVQPHYCLEHTACFSSLISNQTWQAFRC